MTMIDADQAGHLDRILNAAVRYADAAILTALRHLNDPEDDPDEDWINPEATAAWVALCHAAKAAITPPPHDDPWTALADHVILAILAVSPDAPPHDPPG